LKPLVIPNSIDSVPKCYPHRSLLSDTRTVHLSGKRGSRFNKREGKVQTCRIELAMHVAIGETSVRSTDPRTSDMTCLLCNTQLDQHVSIDIHRRLHFPVQWHIPCLLTIAVSFIYCIHIACTSTIPTVPSNPGPLTSQWLLLFLPMFMSPSTRVCARSSVFYARKQRALERPRSWSMTLLQY
jgi:hypothetical protein